MTAKPALKKTNHDRSVQDAKWAFVVGLLDISWRLATVFLVPVCLGVIVDQANNTSKYVVMGTIVGIVLSVIFIIKQALEAGKK